MAAMERAQLPRFTGRVVFAGVALAVGLAIVALIERLGVPDGVAVALVMVIAAAALLAIGVGTATMRVPEFFAAGRGVPSLYRGLAALALGAGLSLDVVEHGLERAAPVVLDAGIAGGVALSVLVTGPLIRAGGRTTLAGWLAARFPGRLLRLALAAAIAVIAWLIVLAGMASAARTLIDAAGAADGPSLAIAALLVICVGVAGGLAGVVWAAAAAAGLALVALAIPVAISLYPQFRLPFPLIGDAEAFAQAVRRLSVWQDNATPFDFGAPAGAALALLFGFGSLAPLLSPAVATPPGASAARAGLVTLAGAILLAGLAATASLLAVPAADLALVGHSPDRLPDWTYVADGHGLVTLCGKSAGSPAAAKAACMDLADFPGTLRTQDISVTSRELLTALPRLRGLGTTLSAAASAACFALGIVLAAAGLFVAASTLSEEALFALLGRHALASPRLAVARLLYLALAALAVAFLQVRPAAPEDFVLMAAAGSCASIAPLLVLALWSRTSASDAGLALLVGAGVAGASLLIHSPAAGLQDAFYAFGAALAAGVASRVLSRGKPKAAAPISGRDRPN